MKRIQEEYIKKDLEKKIVFIVGPRQAGKTWLSTEIAKSFKRPLYLNYDRREDREIMEQEAWLDTTDLLILDELHKMPNWKNYLKGVFDTRKPELRILVTGSGRLETFRQAGDSLAGRFFAHRLLPISLKESQNAGLNKGLDYFLERGGFPEPFLAENSMEADRWRLQYIDGLVRTDILDFEEIHDFRAINLVMEILRERVGSPISYSSIASDVGIAPNTVKKYIQIFEALFIVFRVSPFSNNIARSILKDSKVYFFDTGLVKGDQGQKLENFFAVSLLKHVYGRVDTLGENMDLGYLRTKEGHEVDFCLVKDGKPLKMIEVKMSDSNLTKGLLYFHERYGIPGVQAVMNLKRERMKEGVEVRLAEDLLGEVYF